MESKKVKKIKSRRSEFVWLEMKNESDVPIADRLAQLIANGTIAWNVTGSNPRLYQHAGPFDN